MKKASIASIAVLLLASATFAQTTSKSSTSSFKVVPINDAFAKAGLRALKAIQGDATTPEVTQGGDILFDKAVVDAVDEADTEARTDAETRLSKVLGALHMRHSINNMKMKETEEFAKAVHNYTSTDDTVREMETMNFLPKDPKVVALRNSPEFQKEEECAEGLEGVFRARKSGPIPEACTAMDAK